MSERRSTRRAGVARTALIDTGAFYALTDSKDANHASATQTLDILAAQGTRLFTTDFIIAESHALILNRLRRVDIALAFITNIFNSDHVRVVNVTAADQRQALALLSRYQDKRFSFTDATSFVVMERIGISHAFTYDRNFSQYGFLIVTPDPGA